MELTQTHRDALRDVLRWRRDVRHFLPDPVAPEVLERLRAAMDMAPSVGNARPWRVLQVTTPALREAVIANFEEANSKAAAIYSDAKRASYNKLKLEGLRVAPIHLAVFYQGQTDGRSRIGAANNAGNAQLFHGCSDPYALVGGPC